MSSYFFKPSAKEKMAETLENISFKSFFTCKKAKLDSSPYCLLCYIYILMNKREIYFLCENTADYICFEYPKGKFCKHCKRLEKYNSLFEKIENKRVVVGNETEHSLKLIDLVNRCAEYILKHKKYYILPELKDKFCDICH